MGHFRGHVIGVLLCSRSRLWMISIDICLVEANGTQLCAYQMMMGPESSNLTSGYAAACVNAERLIAQPILKSVWHQHKHYWFLNVSKFVNIYHEKAALDRFCSHCFDAFLALCWNWMLFTGSVPNRMRWNDRFWNVGFLRSRFSIGSSKMRILNWTFPYDFDASFKFCS